MRNAFLIGEKIYLRPLERDDATLCVAYLNEPDMRRTLTNWRPFSIAAEEAWIDAQHRDTHGFTLAIATKEPDRIVGTVALRGIDNLNRKASLGLAIGIKAEWSKGYGGEATRMMVKYGFDTLNLNRISLLVHSINSYGVRAYERAGFLREATLRQHAFCEGRFIDVYRMAILREEWEKTQKGRDEGRLS